MKRLAEKNINTPEEYDRIFEERARNSPHWFDMQRWEVLLRHFKKGGKIVDLGCLDSRIPFMARDRFEAKEAWGLDQCKDVIHKLTDAFPEIHWVLGDVYETLFPNNYFDYVVLGEVIEHLEKPREAISEAMRILKHGGTLALSTPMNETEAGEFDIERHLWSFTKQDIHDLLDPYGRTKIRILGSQYFPVYRYHPPVIIAYTKKR